MPGCECNRWLQQRLPVAPAITRRCGQYWTDGCLAPGLPCLFIEKSGLCVEKVRAVERISGPVPWRTRSCEVDGTGERNEPRSDPENTAPRSSAARGGGRTKRANATFWRQRLKVKYVSLSLVYPDRANLGGYREIGDARPYDDVLDNRARHHRIDHRRRR